MRRFQRTIVTALAATLATAGLAVVTAAPASAAVFTNVTINPTAGTDATLFGGSVTTNCPAGTGDAFWSMEGPGIRPGEAFLGPGSSSAGVGLQSFSGAAIANLKSNNAGSFTTNSTYRATFSCIDATGTTDSYVAVINYTAGGAGGYVFVPPAAPARSTTTALSATPAGPFEVGTTTNLAVTVTPTTGANDAAGSVELRNGTTVLGVDNAAPFALANVSLPVGTNNLTAVFTPDAAANLTGSTSNTLTVSVSAVAPRLTTAVLGVSPTSGNAFQSVTLTCTVSAGTFSANGTANFTDGGVAIGSSPVVNGAAAVLTGSFSTAGAHTFVCNVVGAAPYGNSSSAAVTASYVNAGAVPDTQTVVVEVPQGVLTITTPYTPSSPLSLGTALLNQADSTYSASAQLGTEAAGYIVVSDTRAGQLGWNASVLAGNFVNGASSFPGAHAGLTGVTRVPLAGNTVAATVLTNHTPNVSGGLGTSKSFATYAAGQPLGTVQLTGLFGIAGVPTSVAPGRYTSTVTFTAV